MSTVLQRIVSTSVRSFTSRQQQFLHQNQQLHQFKSLFGQQFLRKMSTETIEKPKIVFVLGAPGSGKGTQCANIVNQYNYVHLSAGDLLRAERNRPGSELAQTIEEYIQAGRIIPVAVTCSLLERAMNEQMKADAAKNKFLIDGFPRNQDNLQGWIEQMEAKVNLQFVLFFECPDGVCIDRCLNRNTGRSDDNMDSLKKRFDVFYTETMPIVDYYDKQNLVRRVKSEKPAELVFEDVRQAFNDYNAK
ncbi:UMP-CMP kinase 2 [Sitodiplosis mosellana]|uniref:UMP-CMP kinase 2 n=1 Tax=Sitodiplosis mosellana TaxID=263140 RepID=UPI002444847C|nr:UMP-CMP kinase 2 [Sitodiplosis mosellana]